MAGASVYIVLLLLGADLARATDTTAPTLNIQSTWIEKVGSVYHFKMDLDPFDDVGVDHIEFRDALNTTGAVPASVAWATYPWTRGQPFDEGFICTALSIEIRAVDAAGNKSAVQKRTFKSPFPISVAPNRDPVFALPPLALTFSGPTMDCKGLFSADFNGDGRDDTVQFDNATGFIKVRCQNINGTFSSQVITLTAGTIQDGAIGDFDKDGKMDLIVVVNNDVVEYHNDGNNVSDLPTFSAITPPGRTGAGISSVTHVAVADLNGDGFPEALLVGTGDDGSGGSIVKLELLGNDGAGSLHGFNDYLSPTGMSADRIAPGDLTGDGVLDVAMISKTGRHIVIFKGLGNGLFGGSDDANAANRPIVLNTYFAAEAIAIGDVAGRGINDIVVTEHFYGKIPADPWNDNQNHSALFWEMFTNDKVSGLQTAYPEYLSVGPATTTNTPFNSDIIIRDYTGDRLPELVIASEFDNGVRTVRLDVPLDNQNSYVGPYTKSVKIFAAAPHPQRLTHARFAPHTRDDLVVASGHTNQISWLFNSFTSSPKANDIVGGVSTDSDPNGTADNFGVMSYKAYPNGTVNYSLTYVNNTATTITGATVQITLPQTLTFLSGDAGYTVTTSGTSKIVSWTTDIPANSAGVKNLSATVTTTTPSTVIAPAITLKKGTTTLASRTMPKVTVTEPLLFQVNISSDSDNTGLTVHTGEAMKYEFVVTNNSNVAVTNVKFGTAFPAGTKYLIESTPPSGTTFLHRGTIGKETGIDWTSATIPAHGSVIVFVLSNVTAAELAIITESTATCYRGLAKIIAPAFKTTVTRSLEVLLTKDIGVARPGDSVHYEFSVHNWSRVALVNAQLPMILPQGMELTLVDTDDGAGNFIVTPPQSNVDPLNNFTNPALDRSGGPTSSTLTWTWATFAAQTVHTVRFTCRAMFDDPLEYILNGTHVTNQVSIYGYNFTGALATNTALKLYAAKPNLAVAPTAALKLINNSWTPLGTPLSGGEPLAPPKLTLQKIATGDGWIPSDGNTVTTVINDTAIPTDGVFNYALKVSNGWVHDPAFPNDPSKMIPAGTATKVVVHDIVPTGVVYQGEIRVNGNPPTGNFGYHFYSDTAFQNEILGVPEPFTDTNHNGKWDTGEPFVDSDGNGKYSLTGQYLPWANEPFTDSNGNGKWDTGEPYTDTNGNHRYDSLSAVRSFTFPAGDIAGGSAPVYSYKVQTTVVPGGMILSNSGGYSGKFGLYTFDPVTGYHLTASNMNFPINGGPKQLKVFVTAPAVFNLPGGAIKSRGEVTGSEIAGIGIPFEVLGGTGINVSGVKMDIPLPKGFLGVAAQLFDKLGVEVPGAVTMTKNSAGVTTVSFGINALRNATALFQVALDPATQSVLKNAAGQIIAPLSIKPTITGSYTKAVVPPPLAKALGAAAPPPTPVAITPNVSLIGALPFRPDPIVKDAKIFVGRCAPAVVRRGETFSIIIFVGNLTSLGLNAGTISMNVPTGTTFVSASQYKFNIGYSDHTDGGSTGTFKPVLSSGKVSWNIGNLQASEGGSVTLTLKVPDTFSGSRIDDNTCSFDVANACGKSAGPMGIVVLNGNETAQSVAALQGVIEGTGAKFNDDVRNAVASFHIGAGSCTVSAGGCDAMHLKNDVVLIPIAFDRTMLIGPPALISASGTRLLHDDPMLRIAVGPGTLGGGMGVDVSALPGLSGTPLVTPNSILIGLSTNSLVNTNGGNVVAAGAGNLIGHDGASIVSAGGGNLVGSGGSSLIGSDAAGLTGANAAKLLLPEGNAPVLATAVGAKLIGDGGSTIVSAGGGNVVVPAPGAIVAAGGGNLIGHDGASLLTSDGAGLVLKGAGSLIGQDGASVVSQGGGNIFSVTTGNLVNKSGVSSLANLK